MYGVIGQVEIDPARQDEAEQLLHDQIIPMVKSSPGFVTGYWLRSDDGTSGMSLILFETEEAAQNLAANRPTRRRELPSRACGWRSADCWPRPDGTRSHFLGAKSSPSGDFAPQF
jgi:Antibiotic biosynthesis monooxygenase.